MRLVKVMALANRGKTIGRPTYPHVDARATVQKGMRRMSAIGSATRFARSSRKILSMQTMLEA